MKKTRLFSILLTTMIITASLIGCGSNKTVSTVTNNGTTTEAEKTTKTSNSSVVDNTTEAVKATEEVKTETQTEPIPTFETVSGTLHESGEIVTYPLGDINNKYVLAVEAAGFNVDRYKNAYFDVSKTDKGTTAGYFCFPKTDATPTTESYSHLEKIDDSFIYNMINSYNSYITGVKEGRYPRFDFNNDGILSDYECMIAGVLIDDSQTYCGDALAEGDEKPVPELN